MSRYTRRAVGAAGDGASPSHLRAAVTFVARRAHRRPRLGRRSRRECRRAAAVCRSCTWPRDLLLHRDLVRGAPRPPCPAATRAAAASRRHWALSFSEDSVSAGTAGLLRARSRPKLSQMARSVLRTLECEVPSTHRDSLGRQRGWKGLHLTKRAARLSLSEGRRPHTKVQGRETD